MFLYRYAARSPSPVTSASPRAAFRNFAGVRRRIVHDRAWLELREGSLIKFPSFEGGIFASAIAVAPWNKRDGIGSPSGDSFRAIVPSLLRSHRPQRRQFPPRVLRDTVPASRRLHDQNEFPAGEFLALGYAYVVAVSVVQRWSP